MPPANIFKPGHAPEDLTVFQSIDVLDPFPLSPWIYEVPNTVVCDPLAFGGRGWAAGLHGYSQDPSFVGVRPTGRPGERGLLTQQHLMTIVVPNSLHGQHPTLTGRWLLKVLSAEIFELAFSASQEQEVWYLGKKPTNRMNYANTKIAYNHRIITSDDQASHAVILNSNGNWKWQCPGWAGAMRPGDELLPRFNWQLTIPRWVSEIPHVVANDRFWPRIPRNATGHTEHHEDQAPDWWPFDPEEYDPTVLHPACPSLSDWEPDAALLAQMPDAVRVHYLQLHGL